MTSKMLDYSVLDAAIGAVLVTAEKPTFQTIYLQCETLAKNATAPGRSPQRTLDRRLQALRRAGKITFSQKTGWKAA